MYQSPPATEPTSTSKSPDEMDEMEFEDMADFALGGKDAETDVDEFEDTLIEDEDSE
jgi:hypothetical protein